MNEFELKRIFNYLTYLRDSEILSDKGFEFTDDVIRGGTHWVCFLIKVKKSL